MSAQMKRLNIADEKFSGKKAFGFSLVRLGNILAGLMIGEVTYFATNSLALTAAAISTGVAIKTAIDAVTDLIMGTIVDRTHTKYGKARPYVLAGILMWITLIACFAVPTSWFAGMAPERRNLWMVVYITVFNALHSAIFSTIVNIAYETHIKRSIVKEENRIKSLTVIGIIYAVGSLVLQMVLPAIINIFHGSQTGFVLMAVVTAIFGIIACIVCFFLCPEYTEEEIAYAQALCDSVEMKDNKLPGDFTEDSEELYEFVDKASEHGTKAINDFLIPYFYSEHPRMGSTDVGDVSWLVPTAQINTATYPSKAPGHSWQNVSCGRTSIAHKAMLMAGKVLAAAAVDLMEKPEVLQAARDEYEAKMKRYGGYFCPVPEGAVPVVPGEKM